MAKVKKGPNKSESIREVFAETPGAMAKEVVATLKAKGIDVTESLVYAVKKGIKKKKGKPGRKPGKVSQAKVTDPSANGVLSVGASITLVKATAQKVGGWSALQEIVEALK